MEVANENSNTKKNDCCMMNDELEKERQTIVGFSVAAVAISSHVPAKDSQVFLRWSTSPLYNCLKMDVGVYVTYAEWARN